MGTSYLNVTVETTIPYSRIRPLKNRAKHTLSAPSVFKVNRISAILYSQIASGLFKNGVLLNELFMRLKNVVQCNGRCMYIMCVVYYLLVSVTACTANCDACVAAGVCSPASCSEGFFMGTLACVRKYHKTQTILVTLKQLTLPHLYINHNLSIYYKYYFMLLC